MTQYIFNNEAKLKRSEYIHFVNMLKPYEAMIKTQEEKIEKNKDSKIDSDTFDFVQKIQNFIVKTQEKIKDKLITLFYNLTIEEVKNLDFETFETLYKEIEDKKPNLIDFLFLPPIKNGEKATLFQEKNMLNLSQASAEIHPDAAVSL
jgi:hypothetical protein